ncbi:MAG: phytoene desaturase family protein [Bacteroidales bacterium]|nr:phytoene desaturase family protein [Bacteroidales bacterium]
MGKIAIVIGSGAGGLATAIRLSAMGHQVSVFEKNSVPGGKIGQINENGYRFDTGPSLFTLPELVDELSTNSGKRLKYQKLDTISRYFFPDGTVFKAPADPARFAKEMARVAGEDPERISKYLADTESLYNLSSPVFLFSAFHRLTKLFTRNNLGVLSGMMKFNPFRSMHALNQKAFQSEHTIQLFDRYATYNGSDPYKAPATLNMIAHLEHNLGAFFPEGGIYPIVEYLYQLALDQGVIFHFNSQVEEILVKNKRATGIKSNGKVFGADLVVSGGDIFKTWKSLLPKYRNPRTVRKPKLSTSAMIFYLGVKSRFDQLDLHNIFFSGNYRAEFRSLSPRGKSFPYEDPTVYVYNSSLLNKEDAPTGCSNLFVMINTAYNRGEDWDELTKIARKHIFKKLEAHGIDLSSNIDFERVATPVSIEQMTLSTAGALYGNSSNSAMSAFNRHPNFSRRIKNLFFVGGSVHPGGGIPLCLASAKIVEEEVKSYLNRQ